MADNYFKIAKGVNLTPQASEPTGENGDIYYSNTLNKFRIYQNGSWKDLNSGASGLKNYITNGDAENNNTLGWATYVDAAGVKPVDGTGGSANVTWTTSGTTPLADSYSFIFTKDNLNRQGQGASYDFTIDNARKASVLQISFDYIVNSGTFTAGNGSTDSDVTIWVYDVTNGVIVGSNNTKLFSNSSTVPDKFITTFQSNYNSTNYRLIFHVSNTTTNPFTLKIDNVQVNDYIATYGMPGYDPVSYTPTFSNLGTGSVVIDYFKHSRRGKFCRIDFKIAKDGSAGTGAGNIKFTLPSGVVPDASRGVFGIASGGASTNTNMTFYWSTSDTTNIYFLQNDGSYFIGSEFLANTALEGWLEFPVVGWSSSVQMSSEVDQRVCTAMLRGAPQNALSASFSDITYLSGAEEYDTHGAMVPTTGIFTAPKSGWYRAMAHNTLSFSTVTNGTAYYTLQILKNSTIIGHDYDAMDATIAGGEGKTLKVITECYLTAGQTLKSQIRAQGNVAWSTGDGQNFFCVTEISSPSAIGATETISLIAYKNTGNHSSTGNLQDIASWTTVADDSHGQFNSTTGVYTVAAPGRYLVSGVISFAANATGTRRVVVLQNSTARISGATGIANASNAARMSYSGVVKCVAGDTIKLQAFQDSGGNLNYNANDFDNVFCITRIA